MQAIGDKGAAMADTTSAGDVPILAFVYDRRLTPTLAILQLRVETCREYAAEMRWDIAGEWIDTDDHALSDDHRPQFDAMVAAMRTAANTGRAVVCLLKDWDRLTRDAGRQAAFLYRVGIAGGYTVTTDGEDDRRPVDRQVLRTARLA
jgi:hypothetical protein